MEPQKLSHFLVAALAIYERDGVHKQRHLNIHAETEEPFINRAALSNINLAIVNRIAYENGVEQGQVKDVVILGISFLGVMTEDEFNAPPNQEEPAVEGAEEATSA